MSRLHSAQLIVVVLAILGLLSDALAQSSTDRGGCLTILGVGNWHRNGWVKLYEE